MTARQEALLAEDPGEDRVTFLRPGDELRITVYDTPRPQGSKVKNQYGAMYDQGAATLRPWREAVKTATRDAMSLAGHPGGHYFGPGVAVEVTATFTFARPATHFGTGRNAGVLKESAPRHFTKSPDLDKVLRSCFDAITMSGAWKDDDQAVAVATRKTYPDAQPDSLDRSGAVIVLRALR